MPLACILRFLAFREEAFVFFREGALRGPYRGACAGVGAWGLAGALNVGRVLAARGWMPRRTISPTRRSDRSRVRLQEQTCRLEPSWFQGCRTLANADKAQLLHHMSASCSCQAVQPKVPLSLSGHARLRVLKLHKNQANRLILQSPRGHNEATVSIVRIWQVGDATCQKIASLVWHQKQAVEASTQKIANACSWMPCFLLCNLAGALGPLVIRLLVPSP